MTATRVSAPGKLMVAGEYAVLSGHTCLVAAVDRRAYVSLGGAQDGSAPRSAGSPDSSPVPREALLARKRAESRLTAVPGPMHVDVSKLRMEGKKLGLGSSAAAAAASAGAVFAASGHDLRQPETRVEVFRSALEGHGAVAPEGSGADVAASVFGGFVSYRMDDVPRRLASPAVFLRVVWTGVEARTSDLVARVNALRERDRAAHDAAIGRIAEAADALRKAFEADDAEGAIEATRAHHDAMAALGEAASAPIVDERLSAVALAARSVGGAAKPSGAGGGDVAIALFSSEEAADRFEGACSARGMPLLSLAFGAEGVQLEPPSP